MFARSIKGALGWAPAALLLSAALALGGCAPRARIPSAAPPQAIPSTAAAKTSQLARVAQDRLARGRYLSAVDAFRAALAEKPGPRLESQLRLGLARAYEGAGLRAKAVEELRRMPAAGGDPGALVEGALLRAGLERKLGQLAQSAATLRLLLRSPARPLSDAENRQALESLAATQAALGQYGQATGTLLEIAGVEGQISPALRMRLGDVANRASAAELEAQLGKPRPPLLNAMLLLALARAQLREGRLEDAASTVGQVTGLVQDPEVMAKARALKQEIVQARLVNPVAVGVILPLSGPWVQPGREVLAAVELGLGIFDSVGGNTPVLYIADSKGAALESITAVDQLVDQHKVMAIIGPMGASASLAAARQAQTRQVPIISLARVGGVARTGDYVFQNALTPERQVRGLLAEAMDLRGKKRFAALAPDNSYGRGFTSLLQKEVTARGGALVRSVYYNPKAKDFTPYVKKLVQLPPGKYRPGEKDAPEPVIDFDALFIPDGPQAVAMAASQLRYYDVTGVLLMGTDLWHDPRLLQLASRDVQGAILPGLFDPGSPREVVRRFVREFQKAMKRTPTLLEAQGYDAARVLRHLITGPQPPRTRPAMRQALLGVQGLPGVCGELRITPQRMFDQPVVIFTVDRSRFRPVEPGDRVAPEPPASPPGQESEAPAATTPTEQAPAAAPAGQ